MPNWHGEPMTNYAAVTDALELETLVPHHNLFLERDTTCRRDVFAGRGGRGLCTLPLSLGAVEITRTINDMKCPRAVA